MRVDPPDGKFGIQWERKYYVDVVVAFDWGHGSTAFQLVSDAITYIMAQKGHKVHTFIEGATVAEW